MKNPVEKYSGKSSVFSSMYPAYIPENMYYTVMEYAMYAGDKSHIWGCHSTYRPIGRIIIDGMSLCRKMSFDQHDKSHVCGCHSNM